MKKILLLSALLLSLLGSVYAQEEEIESGSSSEYGPAAGDFTGAVLFGRGSFLSSGLDVPSSPGMNSYWSVSGSAPYLNSVEAGNNDVSNMLGVEFRYFVSDAIAIKLSGGAIMRNTPAVVNIPSIIDMTAPNASWIPAYMAVQQNSTVDFNGNIGVDYVFANQKFDRVFPYLGINVPLFYGRRSLYDPTIAEDASGAPYVQDIGMRHAEVYGFGGQLVAGIDYYLSKGLYFGFEFKPVSYVYAYNNKIPAPGLESLQAETHTWSFFSQIYLKVGFRF